MVACGIVDGHLIANIWPCLSVKIHEHSQHLTKL